MLQKLIFDNSTGEMFYYSSFWPSDKYLDETKYTVKEVDSDTFDSSLIYYLENGVVKTKSGDTEERKKGIEEAKKEYDANEYQRSRAAEYPSIPDQLDEIYHNGVNAWKAVIKKTKDKYPKG